VSSVRFTPCPPTLYSLTLATPRILHSATNHRERHPEQRRGISCHCRPPAATVSIVEIIRRRSNRSSSIATRWTIDSLPAHQHHSVISFTPRALSAGIQLSAAAYCDR